MLPPFLYNLETLLLLKISGTVFAIVVFLASRLILNGAINHIARTRRRHPQRVASTRRSTGIISILVLVGLLAIIWSIDFFQLVMVAGAILAAIGVAFFAEWSILSNVTISIIMFWRFPIHVGDRVGLLNDKSFSATVTALTPFFIIMADDDGNRVTMPNTASLQQVLVIYNPDAPANSPQRTGIPAASAEVSLDREESQDATPRTGS